MRLYAILSSTTFGFDVLSFEHKTAGSSVFPSIGELIEIGEIEV